MEVGENKFNKVRKEAEEYYTVVSQKLIKTKKHRLRWFFVMFGYGLEYIDRERANALQTSS